MARTGHCRTGLKGGRCAFAILGIAQRGGIIEQRSIVEANGDDEKNCNDHADHIASSHRLRIVWNWQVDDSIANNPGKRLVASGARVCD